MYWLLTNRAPPITSLALQIYFKTSFFLLYQSQKCASCLPSGWYTLPSEHGKEVRRQSKAEGASGSQTASSLLPSDLTFIWPWSKIQTTGPDSPPWRCSCLTFSLTAARVCVCVYEKECSLCGWWAEPPLPGSGPSELDQDPDSLLCLMKPAAVVLFP